MTNFMDLPCEMRDTIHLQPLLPAKNLLATLYESS